MSTRWPKSIMNCCRKGAETDMESVLSTSSLTQQTVECPICTISQHQLFGHCDGLTIVRCSNCGLLYVNPRLSDEARRQHYAEEYMPTTTIVQTDFGARREKALEFDAVQIQRHKEGGKILDVGCAGGAFLKYFPEAQWERYGVEPSQTAAHYARQTYGIQVSEGELKDARYPDQSFDLVTMLDALMLVPDPLADLQEMQRILRPDGKLGIEIPGLTFRLLKNTGLPAKILYGKWMALNPKEHLYFFSDATLRRLLNKAGFEVEQVYLSFPSLYGSSMRRLAYLTYFGGIKAMYTLSNGKVNLATKVLYIARKANSFTGSRGA